MFASLFRPSVPDDGFIDWLFDVYDWLLTESGGYEAFRKRQQLVLPTDAFFPVSTQQAPEAFAQALFEHTRRHARLEHLKCALVPHEETPSTRDLAPGMAHEESRSGAAGTFRHGAGVRSAQISYARSGLRDPESFVATMAHELGHFLIHGFSEPAPGGEEAREPATDVCAVFLGFGVFTVNSAFRFDQYSDGVMQGWSIKRLGYLGERELSYALAIFLSLLGLELKATGSHLRGNPRAYTKDALRHLARERKPELEALTRVVARQSGPAPETAAAS